MLRRLASWGLSLLAALVLPVTFGVAPSAGAAPPSQPGTPDTAARHVTFATYNVDFGADLAPLFSITNLPDLIVAAHGVYEQMLSSNYPERAAAIANVLASERPDVVGLQEADTWETMNLANPAAGYTMPPANDFPSLILADLSADGVPYVMTVRNKTAQAQLPIDSTTLVRYTDYNLVLTRAGLPTRALSTSNPLQAQYAANIPLPPIFQVNVTRGWASVDVKVWGRTFRFFTTHLEAYNETVRTLQANELAGMVQSSPYPVVVTGDFNSYNPDCPGAIQTGAYSVMKAAGLVEVWPSAVQQDPCGGFTSSLMSTLDHRIDFIFFQPSKWDAIQAEVIGDLVSEQTPSGLWPSDHAGSVGTLRMTSGW